MQFTIVARIEDPKEVAFAGTEPKHWNVHPVAECEAKGRIRNDSNLGRNIPALYLDNGNEPLDARQVLDGKAGDAVTFLSRADKGS